MQVAIYPQADAHPVLVLLDMDVTGLLADGIQQDGLVDRHQVRADAPGVILAQQILAGPGFRRFFPGIRTLLCHKAAAFDRQVQGRPDTPEIRGGNQHADNAVLWGQPFELVGTGVRIIGNNGQRAVLFRHRNQPRQIQEGAGEAPEQFHVQAVEHLVTVGEFHAPLLGHRPVQVDLFQVQFAAHHIQDPVVAGSGFDSGLGQHCIAHQPQVDQDLL